MTRPRHEPIVITAEKQMERMRERFSRRELIRLLGAAGAASIAGCGGGGGQATSTPTATATETEAPAEDTATATEAPTQDTATATPTETETETEEPDTATPSGASVEVVDQMISDITTGNLAKFNPNGWNQESAFLPYYQNLWLSWAPGPYEAGPTAQSAVDVFLPLAAKKYELDPKTNVMRMELRDDLTWGDGTKFDADNVMMHAEILRAQLGLGVGVRGETLLPLSMETTGEYSIRGKLLPGNTVIRFLTVLFQGNLRAVAKTHPKYHAKFHEEITSATTASARKKALQKLFTARFPKDRLPDLALSGFKAKEWDPSKIIFEARPEFPWGLDFHPDQDRVFKGARLVSVTTETQPMNAAAGGKLDWVTLPGRRAFDRLDQNKWQMFKREQSMADALYFGPKSQWGQKTERARKMRQAVSFLYNPAETAKINDLFVPYEQSTGMTGKDNFQQWVGDDFFQENFTNYGYKKTGYVFEEKGNKKFQEANFAKNKNGIWVDQQTGEPLAPVVKMRHAPSQGVTRPVLNNIVEQLKDMGLQAEGKIVSGERLNNAAAEYSFDMFFTTNQAEMRPHPYFGYREDTGIGSENLPAQISWWDWHNGYRRVKVPMPVGATDGELTTFDWDKNVKAMPEIKSQEKMKTRVRTLAWVNNQWVPGIFVIKFGVWTAANMDVFSLGEEFKEELIAIGRGSQMLVHLPAGFMQPA